MFQKNQFCIIIVMILLLSSSCVHIPTNSYYIPSEPNMLKLAKKKDLKISASTNKIPFLSENVDENFFNTQVGYSPINHLGIVANHFQWNSIVPFDEHLRGTKSSSSSIALGGYNIFQTAKQKRRTVRYNTAPIGFLLEMYAGYGRGKIDNHYAGKDNLLLKYNKPYMQIGYHWQDEFVGLSWVYKVGKINYKEGTYSPNLSQEQQGSFPFLKIQENTNYSFRESSFKVFMGKKEIKGYIGLTTTETFSPDPSFKLLHGTNMVYTGVTISIDEFYNRFLKNKK